jgi:hypothetical protein
MIAGESYYDAVAEFMKVPVVGLNWALLMDIASGVRNAVGTALLLEPLERKKKPKKPKTMESVLDITIVVQLNKTTDTACRNFFSTAIIDIGGVNFKIEKTMIDASSVFNLASLSVLEKIGATLHPIRNLSIQTATSALMEIKYYADITVIVGGVLAQIVVHAIPRESNLSYGLLLSRGWLKSVRARGNYECASDS